MSDKPDCFKIGTSRLSRRDTLMLGSMASVASVFVGLPQSAAAADPSAATRICEILFTLYPGGTLLDFVGPNEVFSRLPNTKVRFASPDGGPVVLEHGIVWGQSERLADVANVDVICVPGGSDLSAMMKPEMLAHVRRIAQSARFVTSVCTGSIILAAAGLLKGRRSACHWAALNILKQYGAIPDPDRIVRDGRFMSGGGVTAGIDFGLALAAELRGAEAAQEAQLIIQYDPRPPFHAGHPSDAPPQVRDAIFKRLPGSSEGLLHLVL